MDDIPLNEYVASLQVPLDWWVQTRGWSQQCPWISSRLDWGTGQDGWLFPTALALPQDHCFPCVPLQSDEDLEVHALIILMCQETNIPGAAFACDSFDVVVLAYVFKVDWALSEVVRRTLAPVGTMFSSSTALRFGGIKVSEIACRTIIYSHENFKFR
jgi:hypothetical protein